MSGKIIVIGGKGTAICIGEQIDDAFRKHGYPDEFVGWAIDDNTLGREIAGFPVLCKTSDLHHVLSHSNDTRCIFALYKPEKMRERVELLESYKLARQYFATFIHPLSYVSGSASISVGSVVLANTTINANVKIGSHNIINANVVIEHDTQIESCNFFAASSCIGSSVHIGNGCFIGLNASVREKTRIGDFSFVGMGSNVVRNVLPGQLVFGNPARPRSP